MGNTIRNEFNILRLIDSQKRGADPREAKQERGLAELIRQRCPVATERAGCPLPTREVLRDLQLTTGSSGAALAGAVSNPLERLAGAARPTLVLEQAGVETLTINDGQEGLIPRWRGNGGGWVVDAPPCTTRTSPFRVLRSQRGTVARRSISPAAYGLAPMATFKK